MRLSWSQLPSKAPQTDTDLKKRFEKPTKSTELTKQLTSTCITTWRTPSEIGVESYGLVCFVGVVPPQTLCSFLFQSPELNRVMMKWSLSAVFLGSILLSSSCGRNETHQDTTALKRIDTPHVIVPSPSLPGDPPAFSDAQAKRGAQIYSATCANCHAAQQLTGAAFASRWQNRRVYDLYDLLSNTMPQNAPGTLTDEQYLDVVSYLLKQNGFPAGKKSLTSNSDSLKKMRIAITPISGRTS